PATAVPFPEGKHVRQEIPLLEPSRGVEHRVVYPVIDVVAPLSSLRGSGDRDGGGSGGRAHPHQQAVAEPPPAGRGPQVVGGWSGRRRSPAPAAPRGRRDA
ncbi:unnamed protein product, partial [Ectocarpus sp. 13 AM-2016]